MLVHDRPWVYWDDGVLVSPPLLDDDSCLFEGAEDFPIHQLIPEADIEGLAVAVLPG